MMKALLSIALVLCLGLASLADAAKLPFLEDPLQTQADKERVGPPEPANLQPAWWDYFNIKGEELERRIQNTLERLETLPDELPEKTAKAARPLIEAIRANLQALPPARAQPSPTPPAPLTYAESYTIPQLLEIAERLRSIQTELQVEREEIAAADAAIKTANRRIDTALAAYLNLPANDPRRVLRGLNIMSRRSATALAEEQLRIRKAELAANETLATQLANELAVASERLVARQDDLDRLEAQIEEARAALEHAQNQSVSEQGRALEVVEDTPEERATARYRQQRAVRAEIMEAIAMVRLIKLQAQRHLVMLLLETADIDTLALRNQLAEWSTQLANIRQQALTWTSASRRERDRAGDLMAGATNDADAVTLTFLKLLNQDRLNLAQETLVALQRLESELNQAELLIQWVDGQLFAIEGRLRDWLERSVQSLRQLWGEAVGWISASLFKIGGTPVTLLGVLRIVLILTIAWWVSYWLRHALKQLGERREGINQSALYTIGRLSHYLIIVIGIMVGLSAIGIDFTNFALVAGALSIGIGFGLQSIVNNFVSGLILLFERSLKVGDFVELASGVEGEVRAINVRSTLINTNDNIDIVVPNSEFMNNNVINWTLSEAYCRIHLPFKVAYGTDKNLVRQAVLEAAEKLPHTLSGIPGKSPGVWLVKFGESSLDFELVVWVTPSAVKRPAAVHAAYMWEIETALRKYGIEIPLPQRDLRLRSGFEEIQQAGKAESGAKLEKPARTRGEERQQQTARALGRTAPPR